MTENSDTATAFAPVQAVAASLLEIPGTPRLIVGFSGGLDSHVLLHSLLASLPKSQFGRVLAVHVNHAQHVESPQWVNHCQRVCDDLQIFFQSQSIAQDDRFDRVKSKQGLESALRDARYRVFEQLMRDSDVLLLGHHADDQAELLLMRAIRGSGPDGLAGMAVRRKFCDGLLLRPLLACNRDELSAYAILHQLYYINDPSNENLKFDRNFVRHKVLPLLRERWPSATQTLTRTAANCQTTAELQTALAAIDLENLSSNPAQGGKLDIALLRDMSEARRNNALREWIRRQCLPMPSRQLLDSVERELLNSAATTGAVNGSSYDLRRYREHLYLLEKPQQHGSAFCHTWPASQEELVISEIDCTLTRQQLSERGLRIPPGALVQVRSRAGGERIALHLHSVTGVQTSGISHKSIKKLFQEAGVPPWERIRYPLIYINGEIAAVYGLAVSALYL